MRISDLPVASNVNDAQQFEVNDSGNSRRVTFQQMRETVKAQADNLYAAKSHTHTVEEISNATELGRSVLKAASQTIARGVLQAKSEAWIPNISTETVGQLPWARLSGVPSTGLPSNSITHSLAPYNAGDAFTIGSSPNGWTAYSTGGAWYFPPVGYLCASNGTIRIRLQQKGTCLIRKNGADIASWNTFPQTSWTDRSIDVSVAYGNIIQIGVKAGGISTPPNIVNAGIRGSSRISVGVTGHFQAEAAGNWR